MDSPMLEFADAGKIPGIFYIHWSGSGLDL